MRIDVEQDVAPGSYELTEGQVLSGEFNDVLASDDERLSFRTEPQRRRTRSTFYQIDI